MGSAKALMAWGKILEEKAEENKGKIFVEFGGNRVSYEAFDRTVNSVANGLLAQGIRKGDPVCLMLPNGLEFLYTIFALVKIGAIAVPLNIHYRGDILSHVLNNSGADTLLLDEGYVERVRFVEKDLSSLKRMIVCDGESRDPDEGKTVRGCRRIPYSELLEHPPAPPRVEIRHFDPMVIMYTSGTTGLSKGAVLRHRGCAVFARNHVRALRITSDDVLYTCLPLFHGISFLLITLSTILTGARMVIGKGFSASTFWDEIRRSKATYFPMVGAMAHILFKLPPRETDARHSVRIVYSIPAPAKIYAEFEKRFRVKLIEAYGSTDGQVIVYQPYDHPKIGSCGKVVDGFELRIVDDLDEEVPMGAVGEIVYRSGEPFAIMTGYHGNPQATVEAFRNFWFHSGDYGTLDEEGYLHFVDRKRDSIRRRGENISSYEIEKVVNSHEKVLESAAIAVPSDIGEDDVKVIIVPREGETIYPMEILLFCEEKMPYYMLPRYVEFQSGLPKTPNEKVQKYKLREAGITRTTWDRETIGYKPKR